MKTRKTPQYLDQKDFLRIADWLRANHKAHCGITRAQRAALANKEFGLDFVNDGHMAKVEEAAELTYPIVRKPYVTKNDENARAIAVLAGIILDLDLHSGNPPQALLDLVGGSAPE
jgi:hypothetical protein